MTKYRFTSAALSELKEATLHYERSEPGLGLKFLDEIDDTVNRILGFRARGIRCQQDLGGVEPTGFRLGCFITSGQTRF